MFTKKEWESFRNILYDKISEGEGEEFTRLYKPDFMISNYHSKILIKEIDELRNEYGNSKRNAKRAYIAWAISLAVFSIIFSVLYS